MNADNTGRAKRGNLLRRMSTPLALTIIFSLFATGTMAVKMVLAQRELAFEASGFDRPVFRQSPPENLVTGKVVPVQAFAAAQDVQVYVPRTVVATVIDPEDPSKSRQQTRTVYEMETRSRDATLTKRLYPDSFASGPEDREIQGWIFSLRNQPEQERDEALLQRLKQKLTEQFEERHATQVKRVESISSELKRTEKILEQRNEHKAEIIERRLTELLGGRDQLDWNYTPQLPGVQLGDSRAVGTLPRLSNGTSRFEVFSEERSENFPLPHDFRNAMAPDVSSEATLSSRLATSAVRSEDSHNTGSGRQDAYPTQPGSPAIASVEATSSSPSTRAKENELALVATDDIVGIGFRWMGLLQQYERAKVLFVSGTMSSTEFEQLKNALDATALQWKFKARELSSQLEAAKLGVQIAEEKLRLQNPPQQQLEFQKAVRVGQLELETAMEKLKWANEFEKLLSQPEESAEDQSEEESETSTSPAAGRE